MLKLRNNSAQPQQSQEAYNKTETYKQINFSRKFAQSKQQPLYYPAAQKQQVYVYKQQKQNVSQTTANVIKRPYTETLNISQAMTQSQPKALLSPSNTSQKFMNLVSSGSKTKGVFHSLQPSQQIAQSVQSPYSTQQNQQNKSQINYPPDSEEANQKQLLIMQVQELKRGLDEQRAEAEKWKSLYYNNNSPGKLISAQKMQESQLSASLTPGLDDQILKNKSFQCQQLEQQVGQLSTQVGQLQEQLLRQNLQYGNPASLNSSVMNNSFLSSLNPVGFPAYNPQLFKNKNDQLKQVQQENQLLRQSIEARNFQMERLIDEKIQQAKLYESEKGNFNSKPNDNNIEIAQSTSSFAYDKLQSQIILLKGTIESRNKQLEDLILDKQDLLQTLIKHGIPVNSLKLRRGDNGLLTMQDDGVESAKWGGEGGWQSRVEELEHENQVLRASLEARDVQLNELINEKQANVK